MGVEDNVLAKILQEEEDLWAAHQLASTDKRHWNPASTNNTSGLLTGPEYSSDDIGDGPSNVRVSAIGHDLVVLEQGAAFRRIELGGQSRRAARADRRIDIPPDTVIGQKYRINRKIGSGSFGEIYSGTVIYQDSNHEVLRLMILGSQRRRGKYWRDDGKYIRSLDVLVRCPPEVAWHVLSYWPCVWYSWFGRTAGHGEHRS